MLHEACITAYAKTKDADTHGACMLLSLCAILCLSRFLGPVDSALSCVLSCCVSPSAVYGPVQLGAVHLSCLIDMLDCMAELKASARSKLLAVSAPCRVYDQLLLVCCSADILY